MVPRSNLLDEDPFHERNKFIGVDRLGKVIMGALPHCFYGAFDCSMRGQDDNGHSGKDWTEFLHERDSIGPFQLQIDDRKVKLLTFGRINRRLFFQRRGDLIACRAEMVRGYTRRPVILHGQFGMRMHPVEGRRRMHHGIDLAATPGRVVSAAAAGWVVRAGWTGGYGLMVELRHPGDVTTRYSHLSAILCAPGDSIEPGQPLGLVGRTGLATGPHLHFEVWRGGEARDPLPWLGLAPSQGSAGM